MIHEGTLHEENSFVTLTYSPENLPPRGLMKSDLQKYLKRLRRAISHKIKYYACGEYGEKNTERAHYHLIIFNQPKGETYRGLALPGNPLHDAWRKGNVFVGFATQDSMRYTAQYIDKKLENEIQKKPGYDERNVEFQICSQGLGLGWLKKKIPDLVTDGQLIYRGCQQAIPRYYMNKIKQLDPIGFDVMTENQLTKRLINSSDVSLEYLPELDGLRPDQMSEEQLFRYRLTMSERAERVDRRLKNQGKFNKLRKQNGKTI